MSEGQEKLLTFFCTIFKDKSMIDQDLIDCTDSTEIKCNMIPGLSVLRGPSSPQPVNVKRVEKKRVQRFEVKALLMLTNLNSYELLHSDDSYK